MQEFFNGLKRLAQFIGGLVVLGIVGVGILTAINQNASCKGPNCPPNPFVPRIWTVSNEVDPDNPISGNKIIIARATHEAADGRHIDMKATCADRQSISFEFDVFEKDGKGSAYEYSDPDNNGERYLDIIYRADSGHQLLVINPYSKTHYINVAMVDFTAVAADYHPADIDQANGDAEKSMDKSDSLGGAFANLLLGSVELLSLMVPAEQPQDISTLLNAQTLRIQLPLKGGLKEVVAIEPQEASFQDFVTQCGIDRQQFGPHAAQTAPQADQPAQQPQIAGPAETAQPAQQTADGAAGSSAGQAPQQPVTTADNSPSFDCTGALQQAERTVCGDAGLSAKDRELSGLYHQARAAASDAARPALVDAQRQWIVERNACQDADCLNAVYDRRIAELRGSAPPGN